MHIGVGAKNLGSLFSGQSTVTVPSFQRNYSWTKDQLDQFLEDIFSSAETQSSHFWGPIVFLRIPERDTIFEVIDGQQRITTAMILLSLVRDEAQKLENKIVNQGTPGAFDIYSVIRNFLFIPPLFVNQRFKGSYLIETVMRDYVLADPIDSNGDPRRKLTVGGAGMTPTLKKNSRELRKAVLQMSESLRTKLGLHSSEDARKALLFKIFKALTDDFEIHSMELNNEDDAYVLFETLNDRGLRLNPSDLLKTFTLREVRSLGTEQDTENALETWDVTVANLGDNDFTKFLRHYMLTRTASKVQVSKIFKHFKEQISLLGANGATKNLQLINNSSILYSNLLNVTQHNDPLLQASFVRMNSYSDTHRVFLLGMLQLNLDSQQQRLLARAIEHLSFRWIACGKNAQQLETIYQDQVHLLKGNPSNENVQTICTELLRLAPSDIELASIVMNDSIDLQKYILRRIEESTGGHVLTWNSPITLEHLAPQNPGVNASHWNAAVQPSTDDELTYDDYCGNWGNLTLLEKTLNSSIQNAIWPVKVSGIPASHYDGLTVSTMNVNQQIKQCSRWTLDHINHRSDWIHSCVLSLTNQTWVKTGNATITMWREPESLR